MIKLVSLNFHWIESLKSVVNADNSYEVYCSV
jgi:hypothetical protein